MNEFIASFDDRQPESWRANLFEYSGKVTVDPALQAAERIWFVSIVIVAQSMYENVKIESIDKFMKSISFYTVRKSQIYHIND